MNKKVIKIIKEAVWEARINDWIRRERGKEFIELADVEKMIVKIFDSEDMKTYLTLGELEYTK